MKNYLLHSLAIVGAISLIIMACSADNSNNTNNNSPNATNTVGKYQLGGDGATGYLHVINTETGVVKTYRNLNNNLDPSGNFVLYATTTINP